MRDSINPTKRLSLLNEFKKGLPLFIGNKAKNWFQSAFLKGGGSTDRSLSGWARTKRPNRTGMILVDKGNMSSNGSRGFSLSSVGNNAVSLKNNATYASYHNLGTNKMPRREFLGDSQKLNIEIERHLLYTLDKILK